MKRIILIIICLTTQLDGQRFLVFGGSTGWIGQKIVALLRQEGHEVYSAASRLENRSDVINEIKKMKPGCIVNAAGVTGVPNVDWCEDHKIETIRTNIIGTLSLMDVAYQFDIHVINLGTGCIYEYDSKHAMLSGIGFTEEEAPNFHGSFYSHIKCMLDDLLMNYPNVLNLRLRMPISSDLHPRNFVTKITKYEKVVNIPNSMSVLDDLLPLISKMAERKLVGNYNFVNPGVISHNEVLGLYREYVDVNFSYKNFTLAEQDVILKARRSNNHLDVSKLLKEFPDIPSIKESMKCVMAKMSRVTHPNRYPKFPAA